MKIASAQGGSEGILKGVDAVLFKIQDHILNPVVFLLFACALVLFLLGMLKYLAKASNQDQRILGQQHMLWGALGMGIMISVYGIIQFITGSLNGLLK